MYSIKLAASTHLFTNETGTVQLQQKQNHSAGKHAHILGTLYGVLKYNKNKTKDRDPHKKWT